MASIITTISLTPQEKEFLDDNNISPTSLIKNKIEEIKEFRAKPLLDKIERLMEQLRKYSDYLNQKGLIDDFLGL